MTGSSRDGRVLGELLLEWFCPLGRGNCRASPRTLPADPDYQEIDEVPLSSEFTPASNSKSYAIVTPGSVNW